jgi:hypothetical protein
MAEKLLDGADVVAGFQQMRGEAVTEAVAGCGLRDLGLEDGYVKRTLQHRFVQVVAAQLASDAIAILASRWEDPLPWPRLRGVGRFSGERSGKSDSASACPHVRLVLGLDRAQMFGERSSKLIGQQRQSISPPLALTYERCPAAKSMSFTRRRAHSSRRNPDPYKNFCHQFWQACHIGQDRAPPPSTNQPEASVDGADARAH